MGLSSICSGVEREAIFHPIKLIFPKCSLFTLRWKKKKEKKEDPSKFLIFFFIKPDSLTTGEHLPGNYEIPLECGIAAGAGFPPPLPGNEKWEWLQEIHVHMLIHLRPPALLSHSLQLPVPASTLYLSSFSFFRWSVQVKKEQVNQNCGQLKPRKNIISRAWVCSGYQQQIHANNSWHLSKLENFFNLYIIEWFQLCIRSIIACYIIATASINVVWVIMQYFINRQ